MLSKDDDVWASDEDTSEYDKIISLKEWKRMNENFGNVLIIFLISFLFIHLFYSFLNKLYVCRLDIKKEF